MTVIILTYNGEQWITACLQSLARTDIPAEDILVVDNASSDRTVELVRQSFPGVQVLTSPRNVGFGAGCNLGIKRALASDKEFIFLLNQDTTVAPDCFLRLAEAVQPDPVGIFAPLQLRYDGSGIDPGMRKGLLIEAGEFIDDLWHGRRKLTYFMKEAYGGAVLFHRRVFEVVGIFDECYFLYGEDEDLCRRIRRAGFSFRLVPQAIVYHWHTLEQIEKQGRQRQNPHVRRSSLLLALKDTERTWTSRCLYVLKTQISQCVNGLARFEGAEAWNALRDLGWLARNLGRIKESRDADQRIASSFAKKKFSPS